MTIALLSDFGTEDAYIGIMKGVILGICPQARMIDITHYIEPQNVRQAAFRLLNAYRYFPAGTIFLTVVDPGVGSARRPIAVLAGDYSFVAPDNGLLSYVLSELGESQSVELSSTDYRLPEVSNSFHGRDIFAPAAAHLACGVALGELGSKLDQMMALPIPEMYLHPDRITGEVMDIDHFGNLITNIGLLRWHDDDKLHLQPKFGDLPVQRLSADRTLIQVGEQRITGIRATYSESLRGEFLALVGSSGYLEISVNQGSAARRLDMTVGDRVELYTVGVEA